MELSGHKHYSFDSLEKCAERFSCDVATCLKENVSKRGSATLAVSGGRTPEYIFPKLSNADIPWEKVSITLSDERWVDPEHQDSNEGLARRFLVRNQAKKAHFVGLKTEHERPQDGLIECEKNLGSLCWPLDAIYLGMGEDGHIASLFPGVNYWSESHGLALAVPETNKRVARMSLTPESILKSRQIFLVISGSEKRAIYESAVQPGPATELPVRLILHQNRCPLSIYLVD